MHILKKVLDKIEPTQEEAKEIKKLAESIIRILKGYAGRREVVLAGSVAKGTYLRDNADIDIFIIFKERLAKDEMKNEIEKIMVGAFPGTVYQMNYAEHPYIRFHINDRRIDLVPAYKIERGEERLTAVDRSVLHTVYILKNLKKNQKRDVLLLKQILKANGLYGAEIKIEGLSGYLCELLIITYKSFGKLARETKKWKLPMVIDLKKYYGPKDKDGLPNRFKSDFIVIDPTDKNRNVSAALSPENLKKFISICKRFGKKPSEEQFLKKPKTFEDKIKGQHVCIVKMPKPNIVDDVLWGQLKRFMKILRFEIADFEVKEILAETNGNVLIGILTKKNIAGGIVERQGPPLNMKEHAASFRKAHKRDRIVKKRGKLVVFVKMHEKKLESEVKRLLHENQGRFNHLPLAKADVEIR